MIAITQAVGEGRKATPQDRMAVEGLLQKAKLLSVFGPFSDPMLVTAIRTFQKAAGIAPDGRVDRMGTTLKCLNAIVSGLEIRPITLDKIDRGGYKIAVEPFIPGPPYRALLGFSAQEIDCVEITGRPKNDVLNKDRLFKLLQIIKRLNKWSTSAQVKVYVQLGLNRISESPAANLPCPVHPHNGVLLPLDKGKHNGPELKYIFPLIEVVVENGKKVEKKTFRARMLEPVETGFYLFKYGGVIETDPSMRGFDCITYCGTVCSAKTTDMGTSENLAKGLGATQVEVEVEEKPAAPQAAGKTAGSPAAPPNPPAAKMKKVTLEKVEPAIVKQFFEADRPGRYLMWTEGHVVLVDNMTVYEFHASEPSGYDATDVKTWLKPYTKKKLTVRKV